jgi:hypothetical protein
VGTGLAVLSHRATPISATRGAGSTILGAGQTVLACFADPITTPFRDRTVQLAVHGVLRCLTNAVAAHRRTTAAILRADRAVLRLLTGTIPAFLDGTILGTGFHGFHRLTHAVAAALVRFAVLGTLLQLRYLAVTIPADGDAKAVLRASRRVLEDRADTVTAV